MGEYVLIVDDDDDMRALVADVIKMHGYEVRQARDGEEGLFRVRENAPRLIIVDLCMPRVDGWQFVREIREGPETGSLPIVIMTGFPDCEKIVKAFELPANHVIEKSGSVLDLFQAIDAILQSIGSAKPESEKASAGSRPAPSPEKPHPAKTEGVTRPTAKKKTTSPKEAA